MPSLKKKVLIIGAGLAGSEAAYFLAKRKVSVVLVESKKLNPNPSQKMKTIAELVCSNSLKSLDSLTAHGLLKEEMNFFDSLVLSTAIQTRVPAGSSLSVDRVLFSQSIERILREDPYISFIDEVVSSPLEAMQRYGCNYVLIASGPLTLAPLESWMKSEIGDSNLYFYDAIAPIVDAQSLNYEKLYYKDRYVKKAKDQDEDRDGNGNKKENLQSADYLNAPLTKEEYELFVSELIKAEKTETRDFEDERFFESCLPVDLMARRGPDTLRFSCMRPVGLETGSGVLPYAVVQLRRENLLGNAFNLVGFQTRLKVSEQKRVFSLIPGFENAKFLNFGSVHRNTFLNAKETLDFSLESKKFKNIFFAGQLIGVEGYTESAASGIYAGLQIYRKLLGQDYIEFSKETCIGALIHYLMTNTSKSPSNMNFGILPELSYDKKLFSSYDKNKKIAKKMIQRERARAAIRQIGEVFGKF